MDDWLFYWHWLINKKEEQVTEKTDEKNFSTIRNMFWIFTSPYILVNIILLMSSYTIIPEQVAGIIILALIPVGPVLGILLMIISAFDDYKKESKAEKKRTKGYYESVGILTIALYAKSYDSGFDLIETIVIMSIGISLNMIVMIIDALRISLSSSSKEAKERDISNITMFNPLELSKLLFAQIN